MKQRSSRFHTSVLTSQMIETMAKEARETWADDGEIPDIDEDDQNSSKLKK